MMDTKTAQAYRGYAKKTMKRALAALRQRHAHLLAQNQLEEQSADEAKASCSGDRSPFQCKSLANERARVAPAPQKSGLFATGMW
jgi:site-specific recombinase XerC